MIDLEQGQRNLGWYRARLGNFTGSRVGDLMKTGRSKSEPWGETAKSYMMKIAAERMMNPDVVNDDELFGQYLEQTMVTSKAMRFGTEQEAAARELLCRTAGIEIVEPSSCRHDEVDHFAASPDGLIVVDLRPTACVEIKCPNAETYVKYLNIVDAATLKKTMPQYYWQTLAEMSCTGVEVCYFTVYCPWLRTPLHVAEIELDLEDEAAMLERVEMADEWVEDIIKRADGEESIVPRIRDKVLKRALAYVERLSQ